MRILYYVRKNQLEKLDVCKTVLLGSISRNKIYFNIQVKNDRSWCINMSKAYSSKSYLHNASPVFDFRAHDLLLSTKLCSVSQIVNLRSNLRFMDIFLNLYTLILEEYKFFCIFVKTGFSIFFSFKFLTI